MYIESVQYHSVSPDTSKLNTLHTGDPLENSVVYATAGRVQVGMETEYYENPDTKVNTHLSSVSFTNIRNLFESGSYTI